MIKKASIWRGIFDDFLASCWKSFPEDQPVKDAKLSKIAHSEVINYLSSDAPAGPAKWRPFHSAAICSTAKRAEVESDMLLCEAVATRVKYFEVS
jgi:hypothetical protein